MPPIQTEEQKEMAKQAAQGLGLTNKKMKSIVNPEVSANDLASSPEPLVPPTPQQATEPNISLANNVGQVIGRDLESFRDMQAKQQEFASLVDGDTFGSLFEDKLNQFGATPETMRELGEIELQLQKRTEDSNVRQTQIAGAKGQTMAQAGREVTQEQREEAVRSAGLAARAEVLRGNINTARELATQAVNFAYQDRTLKANNLINQINWLQNQVDNETSQLLAQKKREYEADLAKTEQLKQNISAAILAGASQEEIAALNSQQIADEQKLQLAQQITARAAVEDRNLNKLSIESRLLTDQAQRADIYDQMDQRKKDRIDAMNASLQQAVDEKEKERVANEAAAEVALQIATFANELATMEGLDAAVGFGVKKSPGARVAAGAAGGGAVGAGVGSVVPVVGTAIGGVVGAGVGAGLGFLAGDEAVPGSDRATFEAAASRVKNLLTVDNLDLMSGVLSETDIKILEQAGSTLGEFDQDEEAYRKEIGRVVDVMNRNIEKFGITDEQAQYYTGAQDEEIDEFNTYWEDDNSLSTPMAVTF